MAVLAFAAGIIVCFFIAIIGSLVVDDSDSVRRFGLGGSVAAGVVGVLACALSDRIAVATLGGQSEAFRIVLTEDMNAVAQRANLVAGIGALDILLSLGVLAYLVGPSVLARQGRE